MAVVSAVAGCPELPAAAGSPVPALVIPWLTVIASRGAKVNGDNYAPSWVTTVLPTHAKALTSATLGDVVPALTVFWCTW